MALCPITIVSSCKSCPIFKVCPAKEIIGDHVVDHEKSPEIKEEDKTEK